MPNVSNGVVATEETTQGDATSPSVPILGSGQFFFINFASVIIPLLNVSHFAFSRSHSLCEIPSSFVHFKSMHVSLPSWFLDNCASILYSCCSRFAFGNFGSYNSGYCNQLYYFETKENQAVDIQKW